MALEDPNSVKPAAAAADIGDYDMNEDWTGTYPARYIIRIIDIKEVTPPGGEPELQACFRAHSPPAPLPAGGIVEAIQNLYKPNVLAPDALLPSGSTATANALGYFRSPLDLELLGAPTYVVYILGKPANMYFRAGAKAITHKENLQDKVYYGALRHIQASATTYNASEIGFDGCRIISFIADPPEPPAMPPPEEWGYAHGFNLHLRFTQPPDSDNNPRVLEIDIDPDIRYPGQ